MALKEIEKSKDGTTKLIFDDGYHCVIIPQKNGKKTLDGSQLDFGGQTPPVTNPSPLGENGKKTLEGSILDRNNGATPQSYLDNPPK